jgi:hypothetical protein
MSFVTLAGKTLGGNSGIFGSRRCLAEVKQVEANPLLNLLGLPLCLVRVQYNLDVAALPEPVEVITLIRQQVIEPVLQGPVQGPFGPFTQLLRRLRF